MRNNIEKNQYIWQRRVMGIMILALAPLSILFGLIGWKYNPEGWWHSILIMPIPKWLWHL